MNSVYHAGEIEVQTRAGVRGMAERIGRSIHATIPDEAAEFIAEQPMLIVSSSDADGHVWTSILTGEPGFAQATDTTTVIIQAAPSHGDPLAAILPKSFESSTPLELGVLVIDLETRSRMRLNGWAQMNRDGALSLHAREVYFNCPKYIQARRVSIDDGAETSLAGEITSLKSLSSAQQAWIAAADTFFIGSAALGGGADASHRGGNPGFVHVTNPTTLEWPDYSGNTMFNTLGNITTNPNAGLLFLDFSNGNTLQLTGQARVVWEPERALAFPGAERIVEFCIEHAVQIAHANPLHFRFLQRSRFNTS